MNTREWYEVVVLDWDDLIVASLHSADTEAEANTWRDEHAPNATVIGH